jgi:hypothetical protein
VHCCIWGSTVSSKRRPACESRGDEVYFSPSTMIYERGWVENCAERDQWEACSPTGVRGSTEVVWTHHIQLSRRVPLNTKQLEEYQRRAIYCHRRDVCTCIKVAPPGTITSPNESSGRAVLSYPPINVGYNRPCSQNDSGCPVTEIWRGAKPQNHRISFARLAPTLIWRSHLKVSGPEKNEVLTGGTV